MKDYNALFFTCSLIEFIGRERKLRRNEVVDQLGEKTLRRILSHADVLHCEPIAKVADEFVTRSLIATGDFDNVAACRYRVPDYWEIGAVYARLIEDSEEVDAVKALTAVYHSSLSAAISRFNSDLYYQPRQYLSACLQADTILTA